MSLEEARNYLKTVKGLNYLKWITDEYGIWNNSAGRYDMPVKEAVGIALCELTYSEEDDLE